MPPIARAGLATARIGRAETRAVEDRLSDALHEQLTQRFIDRRTSVLMKHLRDDEICSLALDEAGGVSIGGEAIGRLDGFRFVPDPRAVGIHGRTLRAAALQGPGKRDRRAPRRSPAGRRCRHHAQRAWQAVVGRRHCRPAGGRRRAAVARMSRCWPTACEDRRAAGAARSLGRGAHRCPAGSRCWRCARRPKPKPATAAALPGEARGIAHQLVENFASLDRATLKHALPEKLGPQIRALRPFGVWFGRRTVYLPKLLRPDAAALLTLLWGVWHKKDSPPAPPAPGLTSFAFDKGCDTAVAAAGGLCRASAAAPSASTCWSGWRTNWNRRWPAAAMPRVC